MLYFVRLLESRLNYIIKNSRIYNGNISNFTERFYADSLSICGGLFAILVFLTVILVGWLAVWYPVRYFSRRLLT